MLVLIVTKLSYTCRLYKYCSASVVCSLLSTNIYIFPTATICDWENWQAVTICFSSITIRRGISVDAAWDHITRSGKSLNASPVRRLGSSHHHRRSSEGRLLLAGGDRTPDLLKKVSGRTVYNSAFIVVWNGPPIPMVVTALVCGDASYIERRTLNF